MIEDDRKYNYEMKCITCGNVFYSNRSTAKYCSSFCKMQQSLLQKGKKVELGDSGCIKANASRYVRNKSLKDKFQKPKDAQFVRMVSYSIQVDNKEDNEQDRKRTWDGIVLDKNELLEKANTGRYVYRDKGYSKIYRLIERKETFKEIPIYGGGVLYYKKTVEFFVYEWERKKAKKSKYKHYFDELRVMGFDDEL